MQSTTAILPSRCSDDKVVGTRKLVSGDIDDRHASRFGEETSSCCCYTVDEGYLLPTMLSALQLRHNLPRGTSDVLVVCFGAPTDLTASVESFLARANIRFVLVPKAVLDGAPMICARFFLSAILEPRYRDILYLDGDTQVVGSLEPLMAHVVSPGEILAAPDPMAVMIDSDAWPWPARRAYFARVGVPARRHRRYFNSGILRFRRSDWDALSRDCLKLCSERGRSLFFRDQDALNIAAGDHHRSISFKWNFPPFFMNFGGEALIGPRIYHFMSDPRPWHGAFAPWGPRWHEPYLTLLADHPGLATSLKRLGRLGAIRYVAQQRVKRHMEARRWGTAAVRQRIAEMEAEVVV